MSLRRVAPRQIRSNMGGPGSGMIPKGVGAPPPPGMDHRRGKLMCIKVRMLDDSVGVFHLGHKALGQALFDEVCRHLNLLECDYFGLEFTDCYGNRCWLDKDKPILRQITTTHSDARFYFIVKFYTPNPADLVEEYTRYLFALQIKRDLAMGELLCNENTAALLVSYIVQSDCGDFAAEDYPDDSYLSSARFIPNQNTEFQRKVMENHMKLIGMSPGESDLTLLETARRCDYYGVKLHAAKDVEGTEVNLTIAHMGIRVFHQFQCVSTFSWAKIRKLSFKRRKLLIKLHPENYQYYKETIEFLFETRNECKNFWKKCVEHHTFFRCIEVLPVKKTREGRFFSKGSAFRYQGRTQKQLIDYTREHRKRREPFTRPIKSGLSSSSNGRFSRPAFFDMTHPAYATVSERSVNLIGSGTLPSRNAPVYCMNGERSMNRGSCVSNQSHSRGTGQQLMTTVSNDRNDDDDSESDCSPVRLSKVIKQSINSTTADDFIINSMEQKQTGSILNPNSKLISATLLNESSDSGAITISDSDSKRSHIENDEKNYPFYRSVSSEDVINDQQSMLESYSSQDFEHIFMPKQMNPKCFDVLKDIVMLERTTVFDLKILTEDFYEILPERALSCGRALVDLFLDLNSLQRFHNDHLDTLEVVIKNWADCLRNANPERPLVGDLLLCSVHNALQYYRKFVQSSPIYLAAIDELTRINSTFADSLIKLQMRNSYSCSINFLMLKVVHRMVVWQNLLGRMIAALLEESDEDKIASQLSSCRVAVEKVASFNTEKKLTLEGLVHFTKFVELGNDLNIVDGLTDPNRRFIRQGWLCKWTKRGFIPHAIILFNDALLFAYRSQTDGFIRNAFLPLRAMTVEEGDALHVVTDSTICLTIKAVNRTFLLSSDCTRMRDLWLEELTKAIRNAKHSNIEELPQTETFVITEGSLNDKFTHSHNMWEKYEPTNAFGTKIITNMPYSTLDVCWHRHATLGINAIITAPANQMSGYLLRKFRNSAGWQKFWVVHANFALTFFRSHQEKEAVAVLPIINYHISLPQLNDKIDYDNVFKLSYNTHCYFFRADSLYAFSKWYECIRESTINSSPLNFIASYLSK